MKIELNLIRMQMNYNSIEKFVLFNFRNNYFHHPQVYVIQSNSKALAEQHYLSEKKITLHNRMGRHIKANYLR